MPHLVETASDRLRQDSGRGPLRCAETAETSPAIRLGLTSIMFHYPGQHNHGGNLLGPDPVDLADIRFVRF